MANRNSLLGRSRPRERLTREEIAALDEATVPPVPPAKPPGKKGGGHAADGTQGSAEGSLEPRVPWLRFQGHRQWPAQARATSGEVRALQAGPRPGRRVTLRTPPSTSTGRHRCLNPKCCWHCPGAPSYAVAFPPVTGPFHRFIWEIFHHVVQQRLRGLPGRTVTVDP